MFTVNLHYVKNDDDVMGQKFPLQTFITDDVDKLLRELWALFTNDVSGINRVVILHHAMDHERLTEADVGQMPREFL